MYILNGDKVINMTSINEMQLFKTEKGIGELILYWGNQSSVCLISNVPYSFAKDCLGAITDALSNDKKVFNLELYIKRKMKIIEFYKEENNVQKA